MGKKLKKSGTMVQSAEEGNNYLKRSWGEDKYNSIQKIHNLIDGSATVSESKVVETVEPIAKKAKLSKHSTMLATANESKEILKDVKIDKDAKTRHQSKQIDLITSKPPKLSKHSTMNATVKESEYVLKDTNIDSDAKTRSQSKKIEKITSQKRKGKATTASTKNKRSQLITQKKKAKSTSKK